MYYICDVFEIFEKYISYSEFIYVIQDLGFYDNRYFHQKGESLKKKICQGRNNIIYVDYEKTLGYNNKDIVYYNNKKYVVIQFCDINDTLENMIQALYRIRFLDYLLINKKIHIF